MISSGDRMGLVERVRQSLASLAFCDGVSPYHVRCNGPHIVIAGANGETPVARLTALGPDAFGLSFPQPSGRWDMLLVDTFEEVVSNVTAGLAA